MPLVKTAAYKIYRSDKEPKKYVAYLTKPNANKKRRIYFGDKRYQQYKDRIGLYSNLDHKDPNRKRLYYDRHGPKDKAVKYSAKWFSNKYLW